MLPTHVCETVFDVSTKPPEAGKYEALKAALNERYDQKPSEVLRQMTRLVGDSVVTE